MRFRNVLALHDSEKFKALGAFTIPAIIEESPHLAEPIIAKLAKKEHYFDKFRNSSPVEFVNKLSDDLKILFIQAILQEEKIVQDFFQTLDGIRSCKKFPLELKDKIFDAIFANEKLRHLYLSGACGVRSLVNIFPNQKNRILESILNDDALRERHFSPDNALYLLDLFPELNERVFSIIIKNQNFYRNLKKDGFSAKAYKLFPEHKDEISRNLKFCNMPININNLSQAMKEGDHAFLNYFNEIFSELNTINKEDSKFAQKLLLLIESSKHQAANDNLTREAIDKFQETLSELIVPKLKNYILLKHPISFFMTENNRKNPEQKTEDTAQIQRVLTEDLEKAVSHSLSKNLNK